MWTPRQVVADNPAWRVSAHDLETIVIEQVAAHLQDRDAIARLVIAHGPSRVPAAIAAASKLTEALQWEGGLHNAGIDRILLDETQITVVIDQARLMAALGVPTADVPSAECHSDPLILTAP